MRLALPLLVVLAALAANPAAAETIGGNPGPAHNYVCPHADGKPPLDCYLDAVPHLYTMCRNVKAIEIIEFGYDKSTDGTNGAKSESCLEKQKQNITAPYKAALREVAKSKTIVDALHRLQDFWVTALNDLKWRAGESDSDYKARVAKPYQDFDQRITLIRTDFATAETKPIAHKAVHTPKARSKTKTKTVARGDTVSEATQH